MEREKRSERLARACIQGETLSPFASFARSASRAGSRARAGVSPGSLPVADLLSAGHADQVRGSGPVMGWGLSAFDGFEVGCGVIGER